jgi:DNA-directed RNA polymerase subunit omega
MIEALKDDSLIEKVGGRFKLCALIQARLQQLLEGERPLIDRAGRSDLELVIEEIRRDLITLEFTETQEPAVAVDRGEALL